MSIKEDIQKVENKMKELENESWAMVVLKQNAKSNKRMFAALIVVLVMWFITIGYLVYVLNDIGTVETSVKQDNENGYNNYIGNDGDITNGNPND